MLLELKIRNKMRKGSFLFLGTGSSGGVPVIGCHCRVCESNDKKNKRLRSSGLLTIGSNRLLIDVGPDFRAQALEYDLRFIDGLFITHTHYDHVGGLEELRAYTLKSGVPLPCYLSESSLKSIKKLFYYHFVDNDANSNRIAEFDYRLLEGASGKFSFYDAQIEYLHYRQGTMSVLGFRIGSFAYLTDLKEYPEELKKKLNGVDVLVLSALRFGTSKVQMNVDEAVEFIESVHAKSAYLMHMSHELEYAHVKALLPSHIQPAYDGLEIEFEW